MYKNIVVGYDGRAESRAAFALASRLRAADGRITAVCVYHHEGPGRGEGWRQRMRNRSAEKLEQLSAGAVDWLETEPVPGYSTAEGIYSYAERHHADLIVVGSSHRGAVGRTLAGHIALGLLNGAPCPVAIAPRVYGEEKGASTRIGVAFDGSPESVAAFHEATALAEASDTELAVLCAVTPVEAWVGSEGWYGSFTDEELKRYREDELERMVDDATEPLPDDVRERLVVLDGKPADVLADETQHLDVLVMGSRGYGPFRRVLLGSTAGAVLRHAHCPVLVVPRHAMDEKTQVEPVAAANEES